MRNQRTFLFTAVVLITASVTSAEIILTVNGLDAAKKPLRIAGKDNLIVTIAGQSDTKAQDISVTCDKGKLEPLTKPGKRASGKYLFSFTGAGVGIVNLNVGKEIIYQLILFYIPETDTVIVFGIDKEALAPPQPKPELELQAQSKQQISASQTTESEKSYFANMSSGGGTQINSFPEPNSYPDLDSNDIVNFVDFAIFAKNWKKSGGGLDGDFDDSGTVDANDLATLAYFWLNGPHPLDVFESFKDALAVGDVNEALTYVAEISRDKYAEIFQIIEPNLSDYAAGMGEMTFDRQRFGEAIYEMQHQDGPDILSFPVFFIRDEDGKWRIFNL